MFSSSSSTFLLKSISLLGTFILYMAAVFVLYVFPGKGAGCDAFCLGEIPHDYKSLGLLDANKFFAAEKERLLAKQDCDKSYGLDSTHALAVDLEYCERWISCRGEGFILADASEKLQEEYDSVSALAESTMDRFAKLKKEKFGKLSYVSAPADYHYFAGRLAAVAAKLAFMDGDNARAERAFHAALRQFARTQKIAIRDDKNGKYKAAEVHLAQVQQEELLQMHNKLFKSCHDFIMVDSPGIKRPASSERSERKAVDNLTEALEPRPTKKMSLSAGCPGKACPPFSSL